MWPIRVNPTATTTPRSSQNCQIVSICVVAIIARPTITEPMGNKRPGAVLVDEGADEERDCCLHKPGDGLHQGNLGAAPAELLIEGSHKEAKHRGVVLGVGEVPPKNEAPTMFQP